MIKAVLQRIKVDFGEWKWFVLDQSDIRRDRRRIRRAIKTAKIKNSIDGRKYFVIRDNRGFPAAYNRTEIKWLKAVGIIPKEATFVDMDKFALAVITSNSVDVKQYVKVQNLKEKSDGKDI